MNDCKINRSIFTQSNLTSANLSNSIIRNSDFSNATFYSAKLFNVRFEDCVFSECNFQYADLRGAKFLKIKEGAFLGAKAFEYQKEFFLDNGVDTKEIIFEPNPKDFEDYEEFYIQGDIVNAKKGEFLLKNKNLIKDVIKKV